MGWDEKNKEFNISIGASKHKNAYKAGCEVAQDAFKNFYEKPDFILLFCSEDYEDNGGLKNFLKGFHENLPYNVPVVGGTICGFLTNKGCFARGAVALAVSHPNINISIGYGENTKRNPKKAAKNCIKKLKPGLSNKYEHKIIFTFVSGTKNPRIPGIKDPSQISSKIFAKISLTLLPLIKKVFKKGLGVENDVLEYLTKDLSDYNFIHGSMASGAPYLRNFQFYNKTLLKDAVVTLALETNHPFDLDFTSGTKETDKDFKVTKTTKNKEIILTINNQPALSEFKRLMNWNEKDTIDRKWTDIAVRYPVAYKKNGKIINRPHLMVLGNYLGLIGKIEKKHAFIGKLEAKNIINSTNDVLNAENPSFGFFSACFSMRDFLGIKVFKIQDILKDYFKDKPFLVIFVGGEGIYKPEEGLYYNTASFTSAIFH